MEVLHQSASFQLSRVPQVTVAGGDAPKLVALRFDLPGEKVNKFSAAVIDEFEKLLDFLEKKDNQAFDALIMHSGKRGNFIAGADIHLIRSAKSANEAEGMSRKGQILLDRFEDLPFPRIMAIEGTALGGGCEISLAGSAILMSNDPSTRIGLPEVLLGIIPGMGGCVRLPQKIGLAGALDIILAGKSLPSDRAAKAGLAEAVLPKENFLENAYAWVRKNIVALKAEKRLAREPKLGGAGGPIGSLLENTSVGRKVIFKKAKETVLSKTKGQYPAPLKALEVIEETGTHYEAKLRGALREHAMQVEARGFGVMAATTVSKHLISLFFLTEEVKKANGLDKGKEAKALEVRTAAVIGAGTMGGGIAQLFADKDIPIRMKDLNNQALALGIQQANRIWGKLVSKKRLTPRAHLQKLSRITPTIGFEAFPSVDFIVEAVVENMDVKKKVLAELETQIHAGTVIASNTSSLSISEMQKALKKPAQLAGMHFFNPVAKMPLVEVIRGEHTSDVAVTTVFQLARKLGKTPITVKDSPGFLVNRLLGPYLNEAVLMLEEGATVEEVDQAMVDFGMPMGPIELIDEVGTDVGEKVAKILYAAFGHRMLPSKLNGKLTEAKRLGKKSKLGFYKYSGSSERLQKELDPEVEGILGISPKKGTHSPDVIQGRCLGLMINEAARCLAEGVVATPADVDLGMIMGTGFPPFRGGLLRYAEEVGIRVWIDKLRAYEKEFGPRFKPSEALLGYAEMGNKFYE